MSDSIAFTLNGEPVVYTGAPFRRLADVLRDDFGLTGTKTGCDSGDCGACTVLLDGRQVCACMVPLGQAGESDIVTVEGLGSAGALSDLQRAFLHHGAAQCGICTPGMLMAAADLLARMPQPDAQTVEDALGGVLCRCTGYRQIVAAVVDAHRFALPSPSLPVSTTRTPSVGTRMPRVDGEAKVSGRDLFGADYAPEDALWLRAVRSPHPKATFTLGNLDEFCAAHRGLTAILSARDVPGENSFGVYQDIKDQPVFADGAVRYRGEAILALVGTRAGIEKISFDDLPIEWHIEDPVCGVAAAVAEGAAPVHESHRDNVLIEGYLRKGDINAAFEGAAAIAEGAVQTAFVEHAYIEPEAGFAVRVGDRIEITACTQSPYIDLGECARVLGIGHDAVRIIPSSCGGGFGGKLDLSVQPLLAVAAWTLKRPVRCVYTRIESMASTTKRHPATLRARAAADADGNLLAIDMSVDFNTGAYASWGPTVANRVPVHGSGPYLVPHIRMATRAIYTNEPPAGAFRGFGIPQSSILQEQLYDDLALELGIDPFEFRARNALRAGQPTATGQVLDASVGLTQCLDALRPHWQRLRAEAEQSNKNGARRRGIGIGCMWYGCGNTAMSNPSTIRIQLSRSGRLTLFSGAVDIGQGSNTVILQICADALGLAPDAFDLVLGDTDLTPDAGKTSASRQTFVSGKAAYLAGRDLRATILRLANAGDDAELALDGAWLTVRDAGHQTVLDLAATPPLSGEGRFDPPTTALDKNGQGSPYATYGFAAQIADLEVDIELGTVHLRRIIAAHDVGRAINPGLIEGQINGGIAQGIGMALMEEYIPGRTENLHDYLIPTVGDVPKIDIILIEDAEPLGPYGAKGIGEPALIPTAPAIFGAIRHATGIRVTRVPMLPHRLLEALQRGQ
jgi:CO/xanthine dehydrogenase Mo-binding subunit/aerobic-type carbon monoxide dehydrogenase small subunit (CoxS/CutS family)